MHDYRLVVLIPFMTVPHTVVRRVMATIAMLPAIVVIMSFHIMLPVVFMMILFFVIAGAVSLMSFLMTPSLRINIGCHAEDHQRDHQRKKLSCCFHFTWG